MFMSFLKVPQNPAETIDVLKTIAEASGYPGVEVFPKQVKRPSGGYGNYINLPFLDIQAWNMRATRLKE